MDKTRLILDLTLQLGDNATALEAMKRSGHILETNICDLQYTMVVVRTSSSLHLHRGETSPHLQEHCTVPDFAVVHFDA